MKMEEEEEEEISKEMQAILNAVSDYIEKHDGEVNVIFDICAFEGEDFDVVDDRIGIYGVKDSVKIALEDLIKMVDEEKDDFINW